MSENIQPLKRVTLSIVVASEQEGQGGEFSFIYGLATEGLSPFEIALQNKALGEIFNFTVSGGEASKYFGKLFGPLREHLGLLLIPETISLRLEVTGVEKPADAEVVKALAQSGAGCGGGSCDCGCS